jgi:hypothetical protein
MARYSLSNVKPQVAKVKFWNLFKEETIRPAAYLLRDATITLIALAILALIFLASKGLSALGFPEWFTTNLERFDELSALIVFGILGVDTIGKLTVAAIRGMKA